MSEKINDMMPFESNANSRGGWTMAPKEFLYKYLHYLPFVILSLAIFVSLAYIKIRYTTQIFRVESSLLIKNDDNNSAMKDQRFEQLLMTRNVSNLSNEMTLLRSSPVLKRVVKDLGLEVRYYNKGSVMSSFLYPQHPFLLEILHAADSSAAFGLKITFINDKQFILNEGKTLYNFDQTIESGGNLFRITHNPGTNLNVFKSQIFEVSKVPLNDVAREFTGNVRISQPNSESTILALTFEGENSRLANDFLNTLMAVYDTLMVEDRNKIAGNTLRFINDRLFELDDTLRGVEGNLRNFKADNQVFDLEAQSKVYLDKMGENNRQKTEVDVKISIVDFLLEYVSDRKNTHELVPTNLGIEEPALTQLVSEYNKLVLERDNNLKTTSPNNALIIGMDNALDKVRREIYEALSNVKHAYNIGRTNLEQQEKIMHDYLTSVPGKSMQLLNKERRQKILEELYSLLLQKKLEISLSSASTISNSRVVEPARGEGAMISPDSKKIYSFYFMIGLVIPIGLIALWELMQDKVSSRADVEKYTDTPILGAIGHSTSEQSLVVIRNSRRLVAEQFRVIRTNLQYVTKKEKPVIMVTSSFSGEGKSFISTNMGAVMALSGKKTVIMEFDIRKPKIVSGLDLKRKMGITNYIIGKASFNDLLVKVEGVEDLYVIPCGPIPPNPAELLLDKKLDELMQEVLKNFEVVIMDTAPVGLVSDATTLAHYADCTLYVVRQGYTFRNQMRMVEDLYVAKKLPSLCLLLNDVKMEGGYYGSYYGGGSGYYGGYGYGTNSGYFEEEKRSRKKFLSKLFSGWRKK